MWHTGRQALPWDLRLPDELQRAHAPFSPVAGWLVLFPVFFSTFAALSAGLCSIPYRASLDS